MVCRRNFASFHPGLVMSRSPAFGGPKMAPPEVLFSGEVNVCWGDGLWSRDGKKLSAREARAVFLVYIYLYIYTSVDPHIYMCGALSTRC